MEKETKKAILQGLILALVIAGSFGFIFHHLEDAQNKKVERELSCRSLCVDELNYDYSVSLGANFCDCYNVSTEEIKENTTLTK